MCESRPPAWVWMGSFRELMDRDVACAWALSESVFPSGKSSLRCCLLCNNHTWHFPLLQPVETSRCFLFQLNPLKPSLLYRVHSPGLWQGTPECQNSLFSITIKQILGSSVKGWKWLLAVKGYGPKDYLTGLLLLMQCCIKRLFVVCHPLRFWFLGASSYCSVNLRHWSVSWPSYTGKHLIF